MAPYRSHYSSCTSFWGSQARSVGERRRQVHLDELAGVAEPGDAQEGARCGERRGDDRLVEAIPGGCQHRVLVADHIDDGTDDVLGAGADGGEGGEGVGRDLVDLGVEVSGADEGSGGVEGALAC